MTDDKTKAMIEFFDRISSAYYDFVDRVSYDAGYNHNQELAYVIKTFRAGGLSILDAGCGPGRHSLTLGGMGHDVVAMDFSREMLLSLRKSIGDAFGRISLVQADTRYLPFKTSSFDAAISMEVMEHLSGGLDDCNRLSAEFSRVLRRGGTAIMEAPLLSHGWLKLISKREPTYKEVSISERRTYYSLSEPPSTDVKALSVIRNRGQWRV